MAQQGLKGDVSSLKSGESNFLFNTAEGYNETSGYLASFSGHVKGHLIIKRSSGAM